MKPSSRRWRLLCATLVGPVIMDAAPEPFLKLNSAKYFDAPGLSVYVYSDHYLEGHQGGLIIVQHDDRLATNGDLTLEPAPGQWEPFSEDRGVAVDHENGSITARRGYPNKEAASRWFNPIPYPDLELSYAIEVQAEGAGFRVKVHLDEPLPEEWVGRVGFNLELFPAAYFGRHFIMDETIGLFHRQFNGPVAPTAHGTLEALPLASGRKLTVAPEDPLRTIHFEAVRGELQLLDGRHPHNNGWFIVRSLVPANTTEHAIEWVVTPKIQPGWKKQPVVAVSQVGYMPHQPKRAVIEVDARGEESFTARLHRIGPDGETTLVREAIPEDFGPYRKYRYRIFDFSEVTEAGLYYITFGDSRSTSFVIDEKVFDEHVWQPTLDYFLPVQMCHMRVNERYRVWHGACHLDDALMAPTDINHFDGYVQGSSTLSPYKSGEHVPGLNIGGWHDAGDYDLRVESQAGTVRALSLIWETFRPERDQTTIDQEKRLVEIHVPDGVPDILQQIEHGVLSIVGGYRSLGRLYRGIISNDLRQYVHLGDAATMTDNTILSGKVEGSIHPIWSNHENDDRWVFTEENPQRSLEVAAGLAVAARALKEYRPELATECAAIAIELWETYYNEIPSTRQAAQASGELALTTGEERFFEAVYSLPLQDDALVDDAGWVLARVAGISGNESFRPAIRSALNAHLERTAERLAGNPYRAPVIDQTWGSAWQMQAFALRQYFVYQYLGDPRSRDYIFNCLDFILGTHPGTNTKSFVSGVGTDSFLIAYGVNRADFSYIPGGVVSGTGYIRPDFPELKDWPFFWQQGEYVIGGGATHFVFLVLAARELAKEG